MSQKMYSAKILIWYQWPHVLMLLWLLTSLKRETWKAVDCFKYQLTCSWFQVFRGTTCSHMLCTRRTKMLHVFDIILAGCFIAIVCAFFNIQPWMWLSLPFVKSSTSSNSGISPPQPQQQQQPEIHHGQGKLTKTKWKLSIFYVLKIKIHFSWLSFKFMTW